MDELTQEELEAQQGADLPDRNAMSILDPTDALSGGLLNLDVDLALDADVAAPIDAAVAANANAAVPIDAAVSANALSPDATSLAVADQDSVISQSLDGEATATAIQDATVDQAEA